MTHQAIYIFRIAKIIVLVLVTITSMALCATWFVGRDRDTEVIDQVVLTVRLSFKSNDTIRYAFPLEMTGSEHFQTFALVAHQARRRALVITHAKEKIMNITFGCFSVFNKVIGGDEFVFLEAAGCSGFSHAQSRE